MEGLVVIFLWSLIGAILLVVMWTMDGGVEPLGKPNTTAHLVVYVLCFPGFVLVFVGTWLVVGVARVYAFLNRIPL